MSKESLIQPKERGNFVKFCYLVCFGLIALVTPTIALYLVEVLTMYEYKSGLTEWLKNIPQMAALHLEPTILCCGVFTLVLFFWNPPKTGFCFSVVVLLLVNTMVGVYLIMIRTL